jgi:hypothetical protein
MNEIDAVGWVNNKNDYKDKIQQAINNPETIGPERIKWMQKIVKFPLQNNSNNLVQEIISQCTSV